MYPISAAARALYEAEQPQVLRITGTDKNGLAISITDADIMTNTFSIDRYSCSGSKLEVGTAISSELAMKLNNADGRFDDIVFEGAELFVEIGIADWSVANPTIYWMPCGYFTSDKQPRRRDIITINAMDRMQLLDRLQPSIVKWTDDDGNVMTDNNGNDMKFNAYIGFPNTVKDIIAQVCEHCNITLGNDISTFPNVNYSIAEMPKLQQQVTYRNLIQWCAGFMGANAWFDWNGQLRFTWYDQTTSYVCDPANRYSGDYYENDLTVTGVQYTNAQNVAIVSGSAEYALDLKNNFLVGPYIAEILPVLDNALSGFTYRPFTATVVNAPYLWPMDVVQYEDKDGNVYSSVLTNVNFSIDGTMAIQSVGETEQSNSAVSPTTLTPEQAKLINEAINGVNNLNQSLTQEEIFNRLTDNGEAQGIYMQDGKLYINLTYARAGTLVLGGLDNQNGTLQVLDADGNLVGYWDNSGMSATGKFVSETTNEYGDYYKVEIEQGNVYLYSGSVLVGTISAGGLNVETGLTIQGPKLNLVTPQLTVKNDLTELSQTGITADIPYTKPGGLSGTLSFVNGILVDYS